MYGKNGDQSLLSLGIEKPMMVTTPDDPRANLEAEYEALGMMVSGSPLSFYKDELSKIKLVPLGELENTNGDVQTAGVVKAIRAIVTRKGSQMAFLDLYDDVSEQSFVLFSDAYAKCYSVLKADAVVVLTCHKDFRKEDSYIVSDASSLGE
jgi:DNA polymerase-3 subunit alpha